MVVAPTVGTLELEGDSMSTHSVDKITASLSQRRFAATPRGVAAESDDACGPRMR